ncbi:O-antigen ligase family protein [Acidiphilium sp. AL]|uniref:O-antigen ligase family protein n=1 Tax=Acidiphilium sp. AL TaxID=2871704 RepID=UPI0021CB1387|nr:O-antigen ligase family protein [Acidiphilium sp. AL]MCU4161565.1 O-antigen ligase family protein [Acidiphilium sp. AL]
MIQKRLSLKNLALAAALIVPLCLLYARAGAEFAIGIVDILFFAESVRRRDWAWARAPWFVIGLIWWAAELICSAPIPALGLGAAGWKSFSQALVLIRLLVFAVALGTWVLDTAPARARFWAVIAACEAWIFLQSWQQEILGVNIFGAHRWPDGALTGPFWAPRAGPPYAHLLFLALLPVIAALLTRRSTAARLGAAVLGVLGFATALIIGQRMPFLLAGLGLAVAALMFRPIRLPAIALGVLALLAIPALRVVSKPSFDKLVVETSHQVGNFAKSPYGELYTRAAVMIGRSPWHGYGFNGFLYFCKQPRFDGGLPALGIGPTSLKRGACNIHPHNFYLQAGVDAGIGGMALFAALNIAWLLALGRGLTRRAEPMRLGAFIGVLTYAWPLASTDNFAVLPMAGWLFVMLGLGLALVKSSLSEPAFLYSERQCEFSAIGPFS